MTPADAGRGFRRDVLIACVGAAAGGLIVAWLIPPHPPPTAPRTAVVDTAASGDARPAPGPAKPRTAPVAGADPVVVDDPLRELRGRGLLVPVSGVERPALSDTFKQSRDAGRLHEAIDILAPRDTPVLAVEDGTIAKLFVSKAGGITVYQFDPSTRYAYYYAHLERYAQGLSEHDRVRRGQVLGYVGTSGNAPKNTPHLHFAVFKLTEQKQWWQGTPINPFEIFRSP